jgi:hypothetical protein
MKSVIQEVFRDHFPGYARSRKLPLHVWKAACSIRKCRTAALGGHIQKCPDGHVERVWYNSCKHRSCPLCAFIEITRWIKKQVARLIKCDYFHVVFTMPQELNGLWEHNRALFTNLFFLAAWHSLKELLANPEHLGALPGAIASFHSWAQTLWLHPHIHFLVTGGGLTKAGDWIKSRQRFLLPGRVLVAKFRGKFLAFLRKALDAQKLQLPADLSRQQCINLFNKLGRAKWHVRIMPPYKHGRGVIQYLGRYVRGGPVSDRRLSRKGPASLLLRYKDETRTKIQFMTLSVTEFISRFIRHIPVTGVHHVRAYGLFAPASRKQLDHARAQLGQLPVHDEETSDWQEICTHAGDQHPELCPVCGKRLIREELPPSGLSPPCTLEA